MESRKLEIVLHSAKDLHERKYFGTMDPYATVWLAGGGVVSEIHKTSVAKKAGCFPVWECPMEFDVVPLKKDYTLFCEIQHDGKLFDRKIGEVQVPFKDLLAGDGSRDKGSYPVRIQSGEVMGSIILSHKFTDPVVIPSKKDDLETTPSKDSSTSGGKNKGSTSGSSEGKTSGNVKSSKKKKDKTPTKKVQGKKKQGMVKRIAKSVGTKVVAEAVLLAGTAVALFALDDNLEADKVEDEEVEVEGEDEDEDEDQNEDEVDEEEEEEDDDDDDDAEEYF